MNTLYRAIVSLPNGLCERDRPMQERIVFFEGPYDFMQRSNAGAAEVLEKLLALAWSADTTGGVFMFLSIGSLLVLVVLP